jgi:Hemerythrin HHE cation binding domain
MKRSPELTPLSRDHHKALSHALRLRRADADGVAEVAGGFLAFLAGDGRRHFSQEEEHLLPALPPDAAALGDRVRDEHAEILRRAEHLGAEPAAPAAHELGVLLDAHVRFEERVLFPLLEERLTPGHLAELGERLRH